MVCITLAFWLGLGTTTCAIAALTQLKTNKLANTKTKLRFRELMVSLLVLRLLASYRELWGVIPILQTLFRFDGITAVANCNWNLVATPFRLSSSSSSSPK
jgi:hypothetical protein